MTRQRPSFPPDVARALQGPVGSVSVRYTLSPALVRGPRVHTILMETPYETVLAALTLDTKLNLRFVRTGGRAERKRRGRASPYTAAAGARSDRTSSAAP